MEKSIFGNPAVGRGVNRDAIFLRAVIFQPLHREAAERLAARLSKNRWK